MARKLEEILGSPSPYFNSCNANAYTMPNHDLYFHYDNESLFREADSPSAKRSVLIGSVSFGEPRDFAIRRSYSGDAPLHVTLCDGDILTMEGLFQDNFQHALLPRKTKDNQASSSTTMNARFNLTFRRIQRHNCSLGST